MAEYFHLNDAGYQEWLEGHEQGYVFNFFGGMDANYNKIHHASCCRLSGGQEGQKTTISKLCSDDLAELEKTATELRGEKEDWTYCKTCF